MNPLPKEAIQAPDLHVCSHGNVTKLAKTRMQKRSEDFWPGVPLGVRVSGELAECRSCHALFFDPSGNLHRVTICQL